MEPTESLVSETRRRAEEVVDGAVRWSFGFGLIPLPIIDLAAISTVQIRMLRSLCDVYGEPFSENEGKALISALLGGIVPTKLAWGPVRSLLKAIPVVGPLVGAAAMPLFASASTYAVGHTFIHHFESGGTLLDLDPAKLRDYVARQFREGRDSLLGSKPAAEPAAG
ncbi:MAG TPA: DUF697 domain-containing protein [Thermoanaerobaculia bacterium]|nr:DUF697 domain-containing protein [Thermoanaerobaculia bacterium]